MPKITPAAAEVEERKGAIRLIHPKGALYLSELRDALIQSLADGHFLAYDSVIAKWKNRSLIAGDVPDLDAAKITSGTFGLDRLPTIPYTKTDFADQELLTISSPHFRRAYIDNELFVGEYIVWMYTPSPAQLLIDATIDIHALKIGAVSVINPKRNLENVTADAGIITSGQFGDARLDLSALSQSIGFTGAQTVDGVDVSTLPAKCVGDYFVLAGMGNDGLAYYRKYTIATSTWSSWMYLITFAGIMEIVSMDVIGNKLYVAAMGTDANVYYKIINLVDDSVVTNWTSLGSGLIAYRYFISSIEPTNRIAGLIWIDTSGSEVVMKVRNKANNGWKIATLT